MNTRSHVRCWTHPGALVGILFLVLVPVAVHAQAVRPALLERGPASLVNMMNIDRLMREGQTDAMFHFTLGVTREGGSGIVLTYGGTPNSDPVSREMIDQAAKAKFIPAMLGSKKVGAIVSGTVLFAVTGGKPRLRIFLHQDSERLGRGEDFVAPQPLFAPDGKFRGFDLPDHYTDSALVAIRIETDASGKLLNTRVLREHPPRLLYGAVVMKGIEKVRFSPAFQRGRPVASSTVLHIPFRSSWRGRRWL